MSSKQCRVICLTRKEGKVRWIHQLPQYEDRIIKRPHYLGGPVLVSES